MSHNIFFLTIFSSSRKLWLNGKNACIKFVWPSWPQTLFNLWTSYNLVRHLISHTPIMLLVTGNDFTSMFFLQKEIMGFFTTLLQQYFNYLARVSQFYGWRRLEYPRRTTDCRQSSYKKNECTPPCARIKLIFC